MVRHEALPTPQGLGPHNGKVWSKNIAVCTAELHIQSTEAQKFVGGHQMEGFQELSQRKNQL